MKIPLHSLHLDLFKIFKRCTLNPKHFHQNTQGWQMDLTCPTTGIAYRLQLTPINEEEPVAEEDMDITEFYKILKDGGIYD